MQLSSLHYFPLAWPFILILALLLFVLVAMVELGVLGYAYERMAAGVVVVTVGFLKEMNGYG